MTLHLWWTQEKFQLLVDECSRVCKKRKLKGNVEKSKVLKCIREGVSGNVKKKVNGVNLEEAQGTEIRQNK